MDVGDIGFSRPLPHHVYAYKVCVCVSRVSRACHTTSLSRLEECRICRICSQKQPNSQQQNTHASGEAAGGGQIDRNLSITPPLGGGGGPRIRVPRPVRARRQNKCAKPAWPCDASFCASLRDPPGISGTPLLNREHVANCPSPNKAIMQYGTHPKMTSIPGLINRNQRRHVSPAHKRVKRQSPRLSQTGLPCVLHYSQHACLRS